MLAFAVIWAGYAWLVRRFWFVCDDAFISFRYARNWADGEGLRYNLGDHAPVEGYSNFLWVIMCGVVERFGGDPAQVVPWISFAIGSALLFGVFRLLRVRFGIGLLPATLATLSLAWSPPFAIWSTSGLETMAFTALFFITFERTVLRSGGMAGVSGGVFALALALTRVEGVVWAAAFGVLGVVSRLGTGQRNRAAAATYFGVLSVGFAAWFGWRYAYYGDPLPNTVYVKVGGGVEKFATGLAYVASFALTLLAPFALVVTAIGALVGGRARTGSCALAAIGAVYLYAIAVGGDFMTMGRILVPSLALKAVVLAWWLDALRAKGIGRRLGALFAVAVVAIGLLPAWNVHLVPESVRAEFQFRRVKKDEPFQTELERWRSMRDNTTKRTVTARVLKEALPENASIVCGAIGVIGYRTGFLVYDVFGLVNRKVARRDKRRKNSSPGHEKRVAPDFFLDEEPDCLAFRRFDVSVKNAGDDLRAQVRSMIRDWSRSFSKEYAPHLVRVPADPNLPDQAQFFLILRRIEPGKRQRKAWAEFNAALKSV